MHTHDCRKNSVPLRSSSAVNEDTEKEDTEKEYTEVVAEKDAEKDTEEEDTEEEDKCWNYFGLVPMATSI